MFKMRRYKNLIEVGLGLGLGFTFGVLTNKRMNYEVRASSDEEGTASNFPFTPETCVGLGCPVTQWDENWDKLANFANSPAANHYILISPGPSDDKVGELTTAGKQIADKLVFRLAKLNLEFKTVVTSPQQRLRSTAEVIAQKLNIPIEDNPMLSPVIPSNTVPPHLNDDHVLFRGSQVAEAAFRELFQRRIQKRDGPVEEHTVNIYVTSANLIRFFLCRALQFPPEAWLRFSVSKGTISWITVHGNGTVEVRCIGEETGTRYATEI